MTIPTSSDAGRPPMGALLHAVCFTASAHHVQTTPALLAQRLGVALNQPSDRPEADLASALRKAGCHSRLVQGATWEWLQQAPLPALVRLNDGGWVVVFRLEPDRLLAFNPLQPRSPWAVDRTSFETAWSRCVMLAKPTWKTTAVRTFGLDWFLPVVWSHRRSLVEVLVAALALQVLALAAPMFSQMVIDKVLVHQNVATLHVLAVGMLMAIGLEAVLGAARTHVMARTTTRIDVILGARLWEHVLHLPLRFFETRKVGDTVAHVRELENVRQFLTGSSIGTVIDAVMAVVFVGVMLCYSPVLTVVALAVVPAFALLSWGSHGPLRQRLDEKFRSNAESNAFLVETLTGIGTVKSLAAEPCFNRAWHQRLTRYVHAAYRATSLNGLVGQLANLLSKLSTLGILWVGAELVMQNDLSIGQLIAFQMFAGRVVGPLVRILQLWQEFQQVGVSVRRLGDIMNTPTENITGQPLPKVNGEVCFERVMFAYTTGPSATPVLHDVSFTVKPGDVVGVVGRSGSGKSTVAKLVQGLYPAGAGRVLIDGQDLRQLSAEALRRHIGCVPQEGYLFSGTVRDNITVHMPGASMDNVIEVARLAGAHEFITALPNGYDTTVGERGAGLSGGQRQRIAIARALISDPKILVFDEATSALDYESERIVQRNMAAISQGRTVFVITHRLSTLRQADRVLVLDQGRLVQDGSPTTLAHQEGPYAHLLRQETDEGLDRAAA